jgi:hypothetical protein
VAQPKGDRPILNPGIARTRYLPMFRVRGEQELFQFEELLDRVGIRLDLPPGDVPHIVPSMPLEGVYATGTSFQVNRVALFTATSKMPGPSFALPAGPPDFGGTCPASSLGEDTERSKATLTQQIRSNPPPKGKPRRVDDSGFVFAPGQRYKSLPVLQGDNTPQKNPYSAGVTPSKYNPDPTFVCRDCYALKNNYNYPSKQVNDMLHLAWVQQELKLGGAERLGHALAYAIQHVNLTRAEGFQPYFRIHDAGDFYSPAYLEAWVVCASLMKHMRFWAPTRQWVFAKWVPWLRSAEERVRAAGGWLVIRPSVLQLDGEVPMIDGLSAGSGVSTEEPAEVHSRGCIWVCPVYNKVVPRIQPDGSTKLVDAASCLEAGCTMCWDQPSIPVSYGAH